MPSASARIPMLLGDITKAQLFGEMNWSQLYTLRSLPIEGTNFAGYRGLTLPRCKIQEKVFLCTLLGSDNWSTRRRHALVYMSCWSALVVENNFLVWEGSKSS